MGEGGHSQQLQQLFETHLEETEAQIERLQECFGLLDIQPRAKACKGMRRETTGTLPYEPPKGSSERALPQRIPSCFSRAD